MKKNSYILLFVSILVLSGCLKKPEYATTPSITYQGQERFQVVDLLGNNQDSIVVKFDFADGDGDLGLDQADTIFPYQFYEQDLITVNENHYNILALPQKKPLLSSQWENVADSMYSLSGRFPRIGTGNEVIDGTINFSIFFNANLWFGKVNKGDSLRFSIRIKDRSFHESNIILSQPFLVE